MMTLGGGAAKAGQFIRRKVLACRGYIDDLSVAVTLALLKLGEFRLLANPESSLVIEAIRRSTGTLPHDASLHQIADYVRHYSGASLAAFTNNIKGIYHELRWVDAENHDGDGVYARLFHSTTHPGSDAQLFDAHGHHLGDVQLKATDNVSYIHNAEARYHDIPIFATGHHAGTEPSGFDNHALAADVRDTLDSVSHMPGPLSFFPFLSLLTTSVEALPVINDYHRGLIPKAAALNRVKDICLRKSLKILCMLGIAATPLGGILSAWLFIRLLAMAVQLLEAEEACTAVSSTGGALSSCSMGPVSHYF